MTLTATIVEHHPAAIHLLPAIECVASWLGPPTRWTGGRAGWIDLEDDPLGKGIKLKGLGTFGGDGEPPRPPSDAYYDRWDGEPPDPHLGFDARGELCLLQGDPAPVGGLLLEGALREQACAHELTEAGVPAVRPAAAIRFDDLAFTLGSTTHQLGLSATISPVHLDHRCTATVPFHPHAMGGAGRTERQRLGAALHVPTTSDDTGSALRLLGAVYRELGTSLRGFAGAGWYRYSGHPGNVSIDDDGRAVLVDLDSCRQIAAISPERAALEEVRDGMSALYNLSCSFYSVDSVRHLDDAAIVSFEPFSAFLDGWDPATAGTNGPTGRAIADYVVAARCRLRRFGAFLSAPVPEADLLYRYVRHDRDLTFSWLLRLLYRRRLERPHARLMPIELRELDARLLRFAGRARHADMLALEAAR